MKILQLGKFYPIRGGVEKVMWNLTCALQARGVDCDMLCALTPGETAAPEKYVTCVKSYAKLAATMIAPAMVSWLRKRASAYDIIHIHHPDPMAALSLRLSGYKGRVVLHWHSDIVAQKALLVLYKPLQSWLIRRADVIVGTTPAYLSASPFLTDVQERCRAIPIGIQAVQFNAAALQSVRDRYPGKTILLSVGRMVPYKGFRYLIEAMGLLPERYHLLLAGQGPLRKELEEQVKSGGLSEKVTFTGFLSDEDLWACFGACDLFVLPSITKNEAFGIVQIEAMSCSKPVVTTRIPGSGVSWVNEDGVSGRNVAPEDAGALAMAIEEVCGRYADFSAGARKRFDSLFREEVMINKILKLYESIL